MAEKKFNSIAGFSVGEDANSVIDSNSSVTANSLSATGNVEFTGTEVSLGDVANIAILGGATGEFLKTLGSGSVEFSKPGVATNVLYVSKNGNDSNDGTSLDSAKLTIKSACDAATANTVIQVKAGDYTESNPIDVPASVSIVGDDLRSVTVRPSTTTSDIFHVRNGCYITGITFRDHTDDAAAVAFPDEGGVAGVTSPYVQNCSSITTTGTGMRIDGSKASGLKSMVADSFTQFNQNGKGIHILNSGYAQLVSIFTICTSVGVLCESGGQCSLTNSNNSFGDIGIKADGQSSELFAGTLVSLEPGVAVVDNLAQRPAPNDAFQLDGDTTWYTVRTATALSGGESTITFSQSLDSNTPTSPGTGVGFYQPSLITASAHTFEYVGTGTDITTATPRLGGVPIPENEVVQVNGGVVASTSTDQFGDFKIGADLVISEAGGTIQGATFERSLFAILTPYILSLEG